MTSTIAPSSTKRIFIVDDHPIVRDGLAAQIATRSGWELCGDAEDVADALARIPEAKPDLCLIDISLKNGNGIDLVKRLMARGVTARILVWSMYPEGLYAERALRAGASGYVEKSKSTPTILGAIETVLARKVYLSEAMSAKLVGLAVGKDPEKMARSASETLTDRELECLGLLGQGLTTRQIAVKMHVSPKTVETYRARIKEKLGLKNATELMHHAVQWVLGKLD